MGQVCHHFGWTLDYLLWEVDWRIVQRMLIDAPSYKPDDEEEKGNKNKKETIIDLSEESSEEFINKLFNK